MFKKIKKLIIKKLAPDYEEIRKLNHELNNDIYSLIMEPNSERSILLKTKYFINGELIKCLWSGDLESDKKLFEGLKSNYMD